MPDDKRTSKLMWMYPILFASFPILHVYTTNLGEARLTDMGRPLAVALVLTLFTVLLVRLVVKTARDARVCASACITLLLSFQYLTTGARKIISRLAGVDVSAMLTPQVTIPAGAVVLLALLVLLRRRSLSANVEQFVAVFALALTAFPFVRVAANAYGTYVGGRGWDAVISRERSVARKLTPPRPLPDIYYIILDSYPSSTKLREQFGYDNSRFIEHLREKGFVIAGRSRSNYYRTSYSLCASLNYDYVHTTSRAAGFSVDREPSLRVSNNRISWVLKELGYQCVFVPSGWNLTSTSPCVDLVLPKGGAGVSEFERTLLDQSIASSWWRSQSDLDVRRYVLEQFRVLSQIPQYREPTFTFAHIMSPHQPIVFDRNGAYPGQRRPTDALFAGQVEYVNKLTIKAIDDILARSKVPPIIVVQGDHGMFHPIEFGGLWMSPRAAALPASLVESKMRDRLHILNAYYLPGSNPPHVPDTITPVNTFRLILNHYFGGDYAILADEHYIPTAGYWGDTAKPSTMKKVP